MPTPRRITLNFDKMVRRAMPKVGEIVKKKVKQNLSTVSHGRVEVYKGRRRWVSKRGDPANNRSFNLTQSVRYIAKGKELEIGEGDNRVNYARHLEDRKGLDRLNLKPAIQNLEQKIDDIFSEALKDTIKP